MENKEINEKLLDVLIKTAAEEAMINELNAMPSREELDKMYVPSPQFKKRMEKVIKGERDSKRYRTVIKTIGRMAAAFAILFTVGTVGLLSVEASRNYIFNTFVNWQSDHTEFSFGENGETELGDYSLGYIPEGFVLESSDVGENMKMEIYTDGGDGQIIYEQHIAESTSAGIDNENKDYAVINIKGEPAHLFETTLEDDFNIFIWQHKQYLFEITSNIEAQEIIKIAENIEEK